MTRGAKIERKTAAMLAAQRRAKRATRLAHVETQSLKWAVLSEPDAPYIRGALERALTAQNAAIFELQRYETARSQLSAEWRNNGR
uniref:Uncharacterized protein n=1 Tax=Rhizobium leguminosarum TaxID=384 RepID=A0A179BT49_RHILE|nr:hypothetical protein A4U53_19615 [Rhizobium leguminosarum]